MSVGGLLYEYWMNGDPDAEATPVAAANQRKALGALLAALEPAELDIPEPLVRQLVPRAFGVSRSREQFESGSRPAFDALAAARAAADLVIAELVQPNRAARLVDQQRRDPTLPGLGDVFDSLVTAAVRGPATGARQEAILRELQQALADRLIGLAADHKARQSVRAEAEAALRSLATAVRGRGAHGTQLRAAIERFLQRPTEAGFDTVQVPAVPPGSPIGCSVQ